MTDCSVIAYGELLWDVLPSGSVLGGAPANFANRLNDLGLKAGLISRVGKDEMGQKALDILSRAGVNTEYIQIDSVNPTGTVDVKLSATGNANYTINKGVAYDFIELNDNLVNLAKNAKMFCFGTLSQRAEKTRETLYALLEHAAKATKFLDVNLRKECYSKETVVQSLQYADILKLNHDEVEVIKTMLGLNTASAAEFCKKIIEDFKISICLVTMAEKGAAVYTSKGEEILLSGKTVQVVDTIGSGDAFSAGFVACYLTGKDIRTCCEYANYLGAEVAKTKGGMSKVENLQDCRQFAC